MGPDEDDLLPEQTGDDRDERWGEHRDERDDEEWVRRERPPHHEG